MRLPAFVLDRLLVAYATGRLPSFAARRMGEAIERDAALASAYDALCRVERLSART